MGVSAGSMAISAHIMTPLNQRGPQLFHAAIMDAGATATGVVTNSDRSLSRIKNIANMLEQTNQECFPAFETRT